MLERKRNGSGFYLKLYLESSLYFPHLSLTGNDPLLYVILVNINHAHLRDDKNLLTPTEKKRKSGLSK